MISKQSKSHSRLVSYFHRFIYNFNPSLKKYEQLILKGHAYRPHYAYALLRTAVLAKELGYDEVSVIEFGCAGGSGLIDIEYHIKEIRKFINIKFEVYGFDSGEGLPPSTDYRDALFLWQPGDFKMNYSNLIDKLSLSKLIIGPVKSTISDFIEKHKPAPIGCIFNDFDYYTSTFDSFSLFNNTDDHFLPRVFMYFDDTLETSDYLGELLAINEFNSLQSDKKIDLIHLKAEQMSLQWNKWIYLGKKFYYLHNFYHSLYSKTKSTPKELPL